MKASKYDQQNSRESQGKVRLVRVRYRDTKKNELRPDGYIHENG